MPTTRRPLALALLLAAAGLAHAGEAEVVTRPDASQYADAGTTPADRTRQLQALADHVRHLARERLPAEARLQVEFVDVDLAGLVKPTVRGNVRIVTGGADWPRLRLHYRLSRPGQPDAEGDDALADPGYRGAASHLAQEPLAAEKRLLDGWFQRRFGMPG